MKFNKRHYRNSAGGQLCVVVMKALKHGYWAGKAKAVKDTKGPAAARRKAGYAREAYSELLESMEVMRALHD